MLVEIGHFALVLALLVALVQGTVPLVGASVRSRPLMDLAQAAALLQFGLVALAFAVFMHAHIVSDFSVRNVFENSNTAKPMLYKVTGVWGSHEGSMMLWVLMLTLFGGLVAALGQSLPATLRARTLAIQGLLGFGTLAFIIGTSNPFDRLIPPPIDGRDLNPLLQDPGLAFHPPFLYFGFVGASRVRHLVHSFAVDPARGVFILALIALVIGGGLLLYAVRAPRLETGNPFAPVSREGALVLNNLLLCAGMATVFLGTFYPLFAEVWSGAKLSVGPQYFDATFVPILAPAIVALVIGPVLAWRRGNLRGALRRLAPAIVGALLAPVIIFVF